MCNKIFNSRFQNLQCICRSHQPKRVYPPFWPQVQDFVLGHYFLRWLSLYDCTLPFFIFHVQTIHVLLIPISPPDYSAIHSSVISTIIFCMVCNMLLRSNLVDSLQNLIQFLLLWWKICSRFIYMILYISLTDFYWLSGLLYKAINCIFIHT